MALFVVLLGPPGAGKGTQAKLLAQSFDLPHVSSGDLFRDHLKRETRLGLLAKDYMDRGGLVPDNVTVDMVIDRLSQPVCQKGAILDGFPRTLSQALALDEAMEERGEQVDLAPLIQVSDDEVVKRLTARRSCRSCGAVYHLLFNPPRVEGVCDVCGGPLYQRDDDNPETVRNRLYTYYKETSPLIGYYCAKGVLREVDGERSIDDIQVDLHAVIEAL
ncbi:MAG TPA: adenylate kinase [Chloroflexi bacterium]|nr:adenylate kinase [Chloroflexota bacterium]